LLLMRNTERFMTKQQGFESVRRFEKSDNCHKLSDPENFLHK